jgi:hypothetical protein
MENALIPCCTALNYCSGAACAIDGDVIPGCVIDDIEIAENGGIVCRPCSRQRVRSSRQVDGICYQI